VIPAGSAPRFAFPDVAALDQLNGLPIAEWMRDVSEVRQVSQNLIVRADPMSAWSARVTQLAAMPESSVARPPEAQDRPIELPVDFGHLLQLMAYQLEGRAAPETTITVTTYWRVTAPLEPRLVLFTHVLTEPLGTRIVVQTDWLAITSHSLQPGDVFMQIHTLEMPISIERGWYDIAVGVYSRDTGARLPIYDDGQQVSDRLFLRPLRVWRR